MSSSENKPARGFSNKGKRLGVFVISYNAEHFITHTLDRIPEEIWDQVEVVFVIDDCSTDDTTRRVVRYRKHQDKIVVFRNRTNRRYGGNQKFGYQYAVDRGLDAVAMLHGDGQYTPEMLPQMFQPIVDDTADIVIGSRMINRKDALKGGMPRYKYVANIFLTWFENLLSGLHLSEFHSGYRVYSTSFLKKVPFWENSDEWHFDSHILFQAKAAKARIHEIPIPTRYGEEVCHVNGIVYGLNCLRCAVAYRLHRLGIINSSRYDIAPRPLIEERRLSDPYSTHSMISRRLAMMNLVNSKVLDLGFGSAAIGSMLAHYGATCDGIDKSQRAIDTFKHLFRKVYLGDLNVLEDIPLPEEKYDIILAVDVLQYLKDPTDVLSRLKKHLVRGGLLVISLPNSIVITNRFKYFFGHPDFALYTPSKDIPLHFHTMKSMKTLVERTGWVINERICSNMPLLSRMPFLRFRFFRPIVWGLRAMTKIWPNLFAYEGVLFCTNPNESDLL